MRRLWRFTPAGWSRTAGWRGWSTPGKPIARRRPDARLWLVGEGSLRSALRRRIEGLNLGGRVVLVGVFDQVDELLAAADLFVRPTLEAGTSLALLEAMAAGLPVVASDIPGHREWIADGRDGLLAPLDDARRVVGSDRPAAGRAGVGRPAGRGRPAKVADFSLAKMADAHLTLFQGLWS